MSYNISISLLLGRTKVYTSDMHKCFYTFSLTTAKTVAVPDFIHLASSVLSDSSHCSVFNRISLMFCHRKLHLNSKT